MSALWEVLHVEPDTGRTLEGQRFLRAYDLRGLPPSHPDIRWFVEAVRTVRTSIVAGRDAIVFVDRGVV